MSALPAVARPGSECAREAFSWLASAVCIVAHGPRGAAFGTTLASVVPVSVDPPVLGFAARDDGRLAAALGAEPALALTLLARGHEAIAAACAQPSRGVLDEGWLLRDWRGLPFIAGGLAFLELRPLQALRLPRRQFALLRVVDAQAQGGAPLVYHRRGYAGLDARG